MLHPTSLCSCFGLRWFMPTAVIPYKKNTPPNFLTLSREGFKARQAEDNIILDLPLYSMYPQARHNYIYKLLLRKILSVPPFYPLYPFKNRYYPSSCSIPVLPSMLACTMLTCSIPPLCSSIYLRGGQTFWSESHIGVAKLYGGPGREGCASPNSLAPAPYLPPPISRPLTAPLRIPGRSLSPDCPPGTLCPLSNSPAPLPRRSEQHVWQPHRLVGARSPAPQSAARAAEWLRGRRNSSGGGRG
uniref:Uncharacterized protein n=1 Tax=Chelydra serpentina TaxID=8475 RepID=A0A8C3T027_CHESE